MVSGLVFTPTGLVSCKPTEGWKWPVQLIIVCWQDSLYTVWLSKWWNRAALSTSTTGHSREQIFSSRRQRIGLQIIMRWRAFWQNS